MRNANCAIVQFTQFAHSMRKRPALNQSNFRRYFLRFLSPFYVMTDLVTYLLIWFLFLFEVLCLSDKINSFLLLESFLKSWIYLSSLVFWTSQ